MRATYFAGDKQEQRPAAVHVIDDHYPNHQIMSFTVPDPNTAYELTHVLNRYFDSYTPDQLHSLGEQICRIAFYWARDAQPYEPDEESDEYRVQEHDT